MLLRRTIILSCLLIQTISPMGKFYFCTLEKNNDAQKKSETQIQQIIGAIAQKKPVAALAPLLDENPEMVNAADGNETCLLSHAVIHHNHDAFKELLARKAKTNVIDKLSHSTFNYAVLAGNLPAVQQLLEIEKPNAQPKEAQRSLQKSFVAAMRNKNTQIIELLYPHHIELKNFDDWHVLNILETLTDYPDTQMQTALLNDPKLSNLTDRERAYLFESTIEKNNISFIKTLVAQNIKPNAEALVIAANKGLADIARLLIDAGVNPNEQLGTSKPIHRCIMGKKTIQKR